MASPMNFREAVNMFKKSPRSKHHSSTVSSQQELIKLVPSEASHTSVSSTGRHDQHKNLHDKKHGITQKSPPLTKSTLSTLAEVNEDLQLTLIHRDREIKRKQLAIKICESRETLLRTFLNVIDQSPNSPINHLSSYNALAVNLQNLLSVHGKEEKILDDAVKKRISHIMNADQKNGEPKEDINFDEKKIVEDIKKYSDCILEKSKEEAEIDREIADARKNIDDLQEKLEVAALRLSHLNKVDSAEASQQRVQETKNRVLQKKNSMELPSINQVQTETKTGSAEDWKGLYERAMKQLAVSTTMRLQDSARELLLKEKEVLVKGQTIEKISKLNKLATSLTSFLQEPKKEQDAAIADLDSPNPLVKELEQIMQNLDGQKSAESSNDSADREKSERTIQLKAIDDSLAELDTQIPGQAAQNISGADPKKNDQTIKALDEKIAAVKGLLRTHLGKLLDIKAQQSVIEESLSRSLKNLVSTALKPTQLESPKLPQSPDISIRSRSNSFTNKRNQISLKDKSLTLQNKQQMIASENENIASLNDEIARLKKSLEASEKRCADQILHYEEYIKGSLGSHKT